MRNAAYKMRRNAAGEGAHGVLRDVLLWAALLLLFVFAGEGMIAAANRVNGPAFSAGPGSQFAIADFDGDGHPDLASVQAGQRNSGSGYWIEIDLSSVGREFLQLPAPTGGLRIEARDVNGDHSVDLVLFTQWLRRPVAIFLNDGHGNFSRVAISKFPGAFRRSNEKFASVFIHEANVAAALPPSRDRICFDGKGLPQGKCAAASIAKASSLHIVRPFLISRAGRAPPQNFLRRA